MKDFFGKVFRGKAWIALLCCALSFAYLETVLHLVIYGSVLPRFAYVVLFSFAAGCVTYFVCTLVPRRAANTVFIVLLSLVTLYFEVQLVYHQIFSEFMPLWQVSVGTTAVTNFWRQMLFAIRGSILPIVVILLPIPLFAVLTKKKVVSFARESWAFPVIAVILFCAFHFGTIGLMKARSTGASSVYSMYCDKNLSTESCIRNLGVMPTARMEFFSMIRGDADVMDLADPGEPVDIKEEEKVEYNALDIDFAELEKNTENESYIYLDRFFHSKAPTKKNKYTGLCEGYNLIYFCAESFSPELIDPELTPTLYRLSHEGFVFNNYYGCFTSNTTNGEYTLSMGLFPDLSRKKSSASLYASAQNYLPFCFGNQFRALGGEAWAYHDYLGSYYNRDVTHPNMGYTFKSVGDGLDMEVNWPASDFEMIEKSVGDYINSGKQFVAYYMTFSGHYQYDWNNPMSAKNRERVRTLSYSDTVKAYIACNLELEDGLTCLMEKLEEAGIADKTIIVLTNDHYPYGLTEEQYNELAGREIDQEIEKYHNSFICYVPGVHEEIDTYCCTVDILPTVSNLLGLSYDSRLLSGYDVLSEEAPDCAFLYNKSIVTPAFSYNAETGETLSRNGQPVDGAEVERLRKLADQNFTSASLIVNNDYYRHVLLGENVGGRTYDKYDFDDLPDTVELGAVRFVYDNGYMLPDEDDHFGFYDIMEQQELIGALYMMADSPYGSDLSTDTLAPETGIVAEEYDLDVDDEYLPAARWARDNGIIDANADFDGEDPVTQPNATIFISRYAALRGIELPKANDDKVAELLADNPEFTEEQVRALLGCLYGKVLSSSDNTAEAALREAPTEMNRLRVMYLIYHYDLYFEK